MAVDQRAEGKATKHPELTTIQIRLKEKVESLFPALDLDDPEVSVLLTDDEHIRDLNREWRDDDHPTDVLSFPLWDGPPPSPDAPLGDIVISIEYAERLVSAATHRDRVAGELGVPPEQLEWTVLEEVEFLAIHSILHLLGWDHATEEDEIAMKAEERRLWEFSS